MIDHRSMPNAECRMPNDRRDVRADIWHLHLGIRHSRTRGFTLIELMAVIGIIIILTALLVGGVNQAFKHARTQQCRVMLQVLKAAADEYEISVGGAKIPHFNGFGTPPEYIPVDWSDPRPENADPTDPTPPSSVISDSDALGVTIERFIWVVMQNRDTEKMIRSIGTDFVKDFDGDGFLEVNDPFGSRTVQYKIVYVAKVSHNDRYTADDVLPEYHRPFFASSGPDATWGTDDDLYSFEIDDTASGSERN